MENESGRSFLLSGGAGFIGSNFVDLLMEKGHTVIVLDALTYAGSLHNLKKFEGSSRFHFFHGNICNEGLAQELLAHFRPEALLNFAAESHVDRSIDGPAAFIETNILGTFSLLNASLNHWRGLPEDAKNSFTFLHVSTDEVYGSLGPMGYFHEGTPYSPNSPYSASKAASDHLVKAWGHTYGLPTITTNCSNNYGPRQYPEKLIPFMIASALSDRPLPIYGDGANVRDWIHVKDHCEGIYLALEKGVRGETYCLGGRSERSNLDVVRAICSLMDKACPRKDGRPYSERIAFVKDRAGHDRRYAIDDSKAERELGFRRKFENFEAGLEETVHWYLENTQWVDDVQREKRL